MNLRRGKPWTRGKYWEGKPSLLRRFRQWFIDRDGFLYVISIAAIALLFWASYGLSLMLKQTYNYFEAEALWKKDVIQLMEKLVERDGAQNKLLFQHHEGILRVLPDGKKESEHERF
jgi:hypothetical protein